MNELRSGNLALTEEQLESIAELAGCNYDPDDIALFLGIPAAMFRKVWKEEESEVRYRYNYGRARAQAEIHMKVNEKARTGNVTEIQIHEKMSQRLQFENAKKKHLYEDY